MILQGRPTGFWDAVLPEGRRLLVAVALARNFAGGNLRWLHRWRWLLPRFCSFCLREEATELGGPLPMPRRSP